MKTVFRKMARDNMEAKIVEQYRQLFPHFEMDAQFMRVPTYPKIVLYSNVASVDRFIEK